MKCHRKYYLITLNIRELSWININIILPLLTCPPFEKKTNKTNRKEIIETDIAKYTS